MIRVLSSAMISYKPITESRNFIVLDRDEGLERRRALIRAR